MGSTSLALSVTVGGVFLILLPFVRDFAAAEHNGTSDAPSLGLLILFGGLVLILLDLVALALGIAGVARRLRKRTLAFLGIVVSLLVLAVIYMYGIRLETPPAPPGGSTVGLSSDGESGSVTVRAGARPLG